jgi:hypothetical protein
VRGGTFYPPVCAPVRSGVSAGRHGYARAMTIHDPLGPQPDDPAAPEPRPTGPPEPVTPLVPDPSPADPPTPSPEDVPSA